MNDPWISYFSQKPVRNDWYFTHRMEHESSRTFYSVDFFEPQNEYVTKYSKEFEQNVQVRVKTSKPEFDEQYSFVMSWMEIPGNHRKENGQYKRNARK